MYGIVTEESLGSDPAALNANGGTLDVNPLLKAKYIEPDKPEEQELPDGRFPTVSYPNPETEEAFQLGLKLAKKVGADLILATDPDADRLGVYVIDGQGEYHSLTGNMSGCLLGEYVLSQYQARNCLPEDGLVIRSIVTTRMLDAIAEGFEVARTL